MLGLCRLRHNCLIERHCVYCTFHQKLTKNSIKMERKKKKKETTNGSVDVSGLPVRLRSQFVECQHHPTCRKECFCEFSFCFPFMFVFWVHASPLSPQLDFYTTEWNWTEIANHPFIEFKKYVVSSYFVASAYFLLHWYLDVYCLVKSCFIFPPPH